jgi:hypothetical protein
MKPGLSQIQRDNAPSAQKIETFDAEGALSRAFLLQRGTCCGNGCKNCPYGAFQSAPNPVFRANDEA